MARNNAGSVEEIKEDVQHGNQKEFNQQNDPETVITDITQILNNLFDPNNLVNNAYLTQRSEGVSFQIPVKYIYDEFSIKNRTTDKDIINQAIESAENIVAIKRNDIIEAVKPKRDHFNKDITIKGISREDENDFKDLVNSIDGTQTAIVKWLFKPKLNVITLVCKDEKYANELFATLSKTKFKDSPIDCSLNFESLYIIALENMENRKRQMPAYPQNRQYMMPQFQMPPFFNPMGFYPPQGNFYMQNPMMNPMNMQMSYVNNSTGRGQGQRYRGDTRGGRGGARKFRGGGGGGRGKYYKNNRGGSKQAPNVDVNVDESEFPPLSGDNQGNQ